ncbi:MAG TPA: DNA-binding response regulator, partial [Aggregicoccus sp.]|nr:DNA-binding response regulator [Aggregicoccus sp.]
MDAPVRVAILEDQVIFRDALEDMLLSEDLQVVVSTGSSEEFLRRVDSAQLDVAIIDLRLERPGA